VYLVVELEIGCECSLIPKCHGAVLPSEPCEFCIDAVAEPNGTGVCGISEFARMSLNVAIYLSSLTLRR
jgi:hypothetical protein